MGLQPLSLNIERAAGVATWLPIGFGVKEVEGRGPMDKLQGYEPRRLESCFFVCSGRRWVKSLLELESDRQ